MKKNTQKRRTALRYLRFVDEKEDNVRYLGVDWMVL